MPQTGCRDFFACQNHGGGAESLDRTLPGNDEQNRQGRCPAAVVVSDCRDGAILCPVAADGAVLLFSSDFIFGLSLWAAACDTDGFCLRVRGGSAGFSKQPDADAPGAGVARGAAV